MTLLTRLERKDALSGIPWHIQRNGSWLVWFPTMERCGNRLQSNGAVLFRSFDITIKSPWFWRKLTAYFRMHFSGLISVKFDAAKTLVDSLPVARPSWSRATISLPLSSLVYAARLKGSVLDFVANMAGLVLTRVGLHAELLKKSIETKASVYWLAWLDE